MIISTLNRELPIGWMVIREMANYNKRFISTKCKKAMKKVFLRNKHNALKANFPNDYLISRSAIH